MSVARALGKVCVIVIISKAGHTPRFAYAIVDTRAESPDDGEYGCVYVILSKARHTPLSACTR